MSPTRLVKLMVEDARLGADIARLSQERAAGRVLVVAELEAREDGPSVTALGQLVELSQQYRRRASLDAAKERLADRPELLIRVITEVVDAKELTQLAKDHLLGDGDLDFIAPSAPHGAPYPVMKIAPRPPAAA